MSRALPRRLSDTALTRRPLPAGGRFRRPFTEENERSAGILSRKSIEVVWRTGAENTLPVELPQAGKQAVLPFLLDAAGAG
jgi:hypothetical protein